MRKTLLLLVMISIVLVSGCAAKDTIINNLLDMLPDDVRSVSELLESPVYEEGVIVVGKVSNLGELLCPCFTLTSGGESIDIWYGLMVEDEGTELPEVDVSDIKNDDWVVVYGMLKSEGTHASKNDFWAAEVMTLEEAVNKLRSEECTAETGESMEISEAEEIAKASECGDRLRKIHFCNENTGTWWIDLDIEKEGCSPACVINVVTKQAEINWRCTGLIT